MALDLKSVARNQFASRTSRGIQSGLTKVAGNILGSSLGSTSPVSQSIIDVMDVGPFDTKKLSFPSDVATDPAQGHYINFSIYKTEPAKVTASNALGKTAKINAAQMELFGGMGSAAPTNWTPGVSHASTAAGGDQAIIGADKKMMEPLANSQRFTDAKDISKTNSIRLQRNPTKSIGTNISLYMPPNISVSYNAGYTDEPIGAVAELGMNAIDLFMEGTNPGEITRELMAGGTQAARQAILTSINAVAPGARALYALEKGQIITPRLELMFNSMGRREFSYAFVFIPRDQNESIAVENIVREFKSNMAADYKENMGNIAGMRTMSIPNIFKIEYMYHGALNTHLNTIGHCALRNVEVSYGSDRFVSYEDGYPQTTKLSLSFSELDIVTKTAIDQEGR
jgi:hypothetical protein